MSSSGLLGKIVNCFTCNKEFYVNPSRLNKNKYHCCSKKCSGKRATLLKSQKIKTNCQNCGKEVFYKQSHFKQITNKTCSKTCRYELIKNKKLMSGSNNPKYLKLTEIERYFNEKASDANGRAKAAGIPFNLTYKDLLEQYEKQKGLCYYSDLPMELRSDKNRKIKAASYNVLSIDRIIPELGYVKENIVLSLNCINMFKSHHSMEDIKKVFRAIYLKQLKKVNTKVKKLYPDAQLPSKADDAAAGADLYVHRIEEYENYIKVYTGVAIQPEKGFYYMLVPRSSSYKRGLTLYNNLGIIDQNYSGEIIGIFLKTPDFVNNIQKGDRLLQLVAQEQILQEFEEVQELDDTNRGTNGFGSSGR